MTYYTAVGENYPNLPRAIPPHQINVFILLLSTCMYTYFCALKHVCTFTQPVFPPILMQVDECN